MKHIVKTSLSDFAFSVMTKKEDKYLIVPQDITLDEAAEELGCSVLLLQSVMDNFSYMKDLLEEDLRDLFLDKK